VRELASDAATPGRHEQDPAAVVAAAAEALAACVAATEGAEVLAVSLAAAMHGLVALDVDLRPVTPLVTWADGRATGTARSLHDEGIAAGLHAATGVPVHPMSPLAKLRWFERHDPATWARARWWVGVKELLLVWLTGSLATERSSASGTGLLDVVTGRWSPTALAAAGVDADRLPEVLPTTATLALAGPAATGVGLPAGTPVVAGAADGPLANLGSGALAPGTAGLSLGTSGAVRMAVDSPRVDDRGRSFCYSLTDELWVIGGAVSNGAGVLRWAGSALAPDLAGGDGDEAGDAALLALAAGAPPGSDGLVMLPHLLPERAPLWDPDLPGAYLGLRAHHTRAHLVRAAMEGVGLQLRLVLDALDEVVPVATVRGTGGAFRAPLWRQVVGAALGRPLTVVGAEDGTALGAAALALVALGAASDLVVAVDALSRPGSRDVEVVTVEPGLVAASEATRAAVPALLAGLEGMAALAGGGSP
jgi:gluconokinase